MKKIFFGSICILVFAVLSQASQDLRPYRLINSDRLNIDLIEEEYLTRLAGNVHFFYGETEFFADRAEIFEIQKIVRMFGNVKVFDDSLSLCSDQAEYHRLTEEIFLTGNVFIREEHIDGSIRTFSADRGNYQRTEQKIFAHKNIDFYDERENISGQSNYLEYNLDTGYGLILQSPKISIGQEETLIISAEKIEHYRDYNRIAASFNVVTEYDEYRIESDFLLFFSEEEYAVFLGEPRLYSEMADASAESFYIYFDDRKMKSATLERDSEMFFSSEKGGEKINRVNSVMIDMFFEEGKISKLHAYQNVRSTYISSSTEKNSYKNYTESDELFAIINNDSEIESISFSGRVKGTYLFSDKPLNQ